MSQGSFSVLFAAVLVPVLAAVPRAQEPAPARGAERLTFEDVRKQISWSGNQQAVAWSWAWDGKHLQTTEGGKPVWFDPVTRKRVDAQPPQAAQAHAEESVPEQSKPKRTARLRDGDVWIEEARARGPRNARSGGAREGTPSGGQPAAEAVRVTTDGDAGGKKTEAHLSPDEKHVSFVRGNDLVVVDVATKQAWEVTTDGGPELFHGVLDWVYQEELYGRGDFQGHWWSPSGAHVAFLSLDESPVKEFTLVNDVPEGFLDKERSVETEVSNYPKAGDPNPFARVSVADVAAKKVVAVDLSAFPKDVLVVRACWTPDGRTLLLVLQDRIQTTADLVAVDPASGVVAPWIHEQSSTWVNRPEEPRWLADGSFLWLSERTGYLHVYRYEAGGKLVNAVTSGEWQVRSIEGIDEKAGVLWFEGTKDGAIDRNLYRVNLDGSGLVRLTPGAGVHFASLSADRAFVLDQWTALDRPRTARVLDGKTGEVLAELGSADAGAMAKYASTPKQRVTIPARDGYPLDGSLQLPVDRKDGARSPVYLPTYSGPDAPTVRDAWSHSTWHQFLAQQGFIVLQVNVRSASGRGQAHTGLAYRQLGIPELKDLEDAVDWVCKEHGGDPNRVAIAGSSYGGFMAAFALTHSKKFALGLAGSGVYDWRLYDTIYTERYMRLPDENKAGYDATSVIKAAKDLHGHLVIVHGTMDDNVHLQNAMQLVWELQKAGKQNFELMLYPRSRHGIAREVAGHQREYEWLRLQRLLDPAFKGM